jgi:O-antigen/teichoic acid export membrane protein
MSRYATREDDNLLRSYVISVRLLVIVSLPIAMSVTFLAEPLSGWWAARNISTCPRP